jgi:hypothetical protein
MTYDNSRPTPPSKWAALLGHLPVALAVVAAAALFVGLHVASTALLVIAAGHLAAAGAVWLAVRHRGRTQ